MKARFHGALLSDFAGQPSSRASLLGRMTDLWRMAGEKWKMNIRIRSFSVGLFVGIITSVMTVSTGSVLAQAKMEFRALSHDFGKVKAGRKAVHTYKFKNNGDRELRISEVKTTCGCTVAEYFKGVIAPGKKGKIRVEFDTNGKSGHYTKGVNVYYNGGEANLLVFIEVLGVPEPGGKGMP